MKKTLSVLLATAMLCGAVNAYDISGGALQAAPTAVQTDLSASLTTLGLDALTVTGSSASSSTAKLGDRITVFASGSATGTHVVAARLDTSNQTAALAASTDFGAVCAAIVKLVSPTASSQTVSTALKLDQAAPVTNGENLRTYTANGVLYTYEVRADSVRFAAMPLPEAANGVQLVVNDTFLSLDVAPRIVNGRTLVPVRGIFEQLGATVEWNQGTQTATMTRGGVDVKVTIGSKTATVGGETRTLDVPAQLSSPTGAARTLVPVRFISESLGALVGWNADASTVVISAK